MIDLYSATAAEDRLQSDVSILGTASDYGVAAIINYYVPVTT